MKFKTLGVVSSLAIIACLSTPAFAQDDTTGEGAVGTVDEQQEEQQAGRSNEILVTAEFREACPASATVMCRERGSSQVRGFGGSPSASPDR